MDAAIRELTAGLNVLKVKVYNNAGLTIYSSEFVQIGESKHGTAGFEKTRSTATAVSKLSYRDSFSALSGLLFKRDVVETYVPVLTPSGSIDGVFELYTDVTSDVAAIEQFVWTVAAILILAFGCLFGALLVIVKRADEILRKQYLQLEEFNTNLEQLVNERTQEAVSATRDAEEANAAKTVFLANMSHEIRTPMNGIIGMADILSRSQLGNRQRHQLTLIQNSAQSLLGLLNDILDISRIESGRVELEPAYFDIREVAGDAIYVLAEQARGKGLELAFEVDSDVAHLIFGDQMRLRQVLINLIGNAIKFTEAGSVTLRVSTEHTTNGDVVLRFSVCDTGIGIAPEIGPTIFNPFRQADLSVTRRFGGSGLGLSISHHLVTLMGGTLDYVSEQDVGSEFFFSMPTRVIDEQPSRDPELMRQLSNCRVLVADQNSASLEIAMNYLGSWNVKAETVQDGEAVINELRRAESDGTPYSVLLANSSLPDMSGLQLASRLWADKQLKKIRVLLLTPVNWSENLKDCESRNIVDTLTKPLRQSQLFEALTMVSRDDVVAIEDKISTNAGCHDAAAPRVFSNHVLIVEDNPVNQQVAAYYLRGLGCTFDIANDGVEAIEAERGGNYDAIFMDCQMPQVDGYEATKAIRARELASGSKRIPIIAVTAGALKGDKELCLAAGMDDYVTKPYAPTAIEAMLLKWVPNGLQTAEQVGLCDSLLETECNGIEEGCANNKPEPLDRQQIIQWRTGRPGLLQRLVATYLDHASPQIEVLQRAFAESDFVAMKLTAHSLKSSSANVGASNLAELCQLMEVHAQNGNIKGTELVLENICVEFPRVKEALARENIDFASSAHG